MANKTIPALPIYGSQDSDKTIPALPIYGSQDSDKRKKDLIEITKNDGTYATPTYGTGASRKMSVEELKTALDITSQTVTDGITDKSPSENAVFDAVYAKGLINGTIWVNAYTALGDFNLSIDKYNNVGYTDAEGPISVILPTHTASMSGKTIIVEPHRFNSGLTNVNISIPGLQVDGGGGAGTYTEVITKMGQIVTIQANYYGWHVIGHTNQVPDISFKLDLDGSNANQDIDIDGFGVNAKHFKVNGTGGAGHIGLKHQSANISASASESSIGADIVGDPVWKNDGGAIDKLELQSNKTSTVTGNEASVSKYLTVKGVYDWAVGLFAPKASPTFTGTVSIGALTPNASAILQVDSTTKGSLATPRMTNAQMTAIASPATGLLVYQTDGTAGLYQYNGTAWVGFASMSGLSANYTPYWDGTKLINSDLYRVSGAGQTSGIATRSARLFQAFNSEANGENALGVYKQINTNTYDAQIIYSNSSGLNISANNAPAGSASLSNYALRVYNNTTNGSYIAWLQATDKTLAEAQLTGVNIGTIIIRRDGTISSATPPVNYNTGFYFEIRPSTDLTYNKYGNFYLALIDVANKKSGFQFIVNFNKRMTLHEDGGLLIGTGAVPNASAALDVDSTTKGFLPPRMTNAQRTAIASPAVGLMVYCTDATEGLWINKSTGWTFII